MIAISVVLVNLQESENAARQACAGGARAEARREHEELPVHTRLEDEQRRDDVAQVHSKSNDFLLSAYCTFCRRA